MARGAGQVQCIELGRPEEPDQGEEQACCGEDRSKAVGDHRPGDGQMADRTLPRRSPLRTYAGDHRNVRSTTPSDRSKHPFFQVRLVAGERTLLFPHVSYQGGYAPFGHAGAIARKLCPKSQPVRATSITTALAVRRFAGFPSITPPFSPASSPSPTPPRSVPRSAPRPSADCRSHTRTPAHVRPSCPAAAATRTHRPHAPRPTA